ncbi:MAG: hypothetical protein JO187_10795 [Acidobacteria bacterium]|nr:hypothetical protein [Acidobacteriota bacterium]
MTQLLSRCIPLTPVDDVTGAPIITNPSATESAVLRTRRNTIEKPAFGATFRMIAPENALWRMITAEGWQPKADFFSAGAPKQYAFRSQTFGMFRLQAGAFART